MDVCVDRRTNEDRRASHLYDAAVRLPQEVAVPLTEAAQVQGVDGHMGAELATCCVRDTTTTVTANTTTTTNPG